MSTTPLGARTRTTLTGPTRALACRLGAVLLAGSLLLAGCGDDEPGSDATPEPTSSPSGSTSGSTSAEPSPDGGVAPATGPVVDTSFFSANAPKGWRVSETAADFSIVADDRRSGDLIAFQLVDNNGNDLTLKQLADQALRFSIWPTKPSVARETTLAGEPAYHLVGPVGGGGIVDVRGLAHGSKNVMVEFRSYGSQRELDEMVESVLATWQWK